MVSYHSCKTIQINVVGSDSSLHCSREVFGLEVLEDTGDGILSRSCTAGRSWECILENDAGIIVSNTSFQEVADIMLLPCHVTGSTFRHQICSRIEGLGSRLCNNRFDVLRSCNLSCFGLN